MAGFCRSLANLGLPGKASTAVCTGGGRGLHPAWREVEHISSGWLPSHEGLDLVLVTQVHACVGCLVSPGAQWFLLDSG